MYRHIVFDVDGTLIDTEYAVLHSFQDTLLLLTGKKISTEELTFALGITGEDALNQLGIKDTSSVLELWNKNMRRYADTVSVFSGITELLENLLRQNCKIGIVTSRTREEFEHDLSHLPINRFFETIVCADDTQAHKPDAAPLLKYMESTGAECGETLYIGDSKYDSACAENAGVDFALALWGSHSRTIKANYYPEKPADLLSVITF